MVTEVKAVAVVLVEAEEKVEKAEHLVKMEEKSEESEVFLEAGGKATVVVKMEMEEVAKVAKAAD